MAFSSRCVYSDKSCPSASTGAAGHWYSRWCRAATGGTDRQRRSGSQAALPGACARPSTGESRTTVLELPFTDYKNSYLLFPHDVFSRRRSRYVWLFERVIIPWVTSQRRGMSLRKATGVENESVMTASAALNKRRTRARISVRCGGSDSWKTKDLIDDSSRISCSTSTC